MIAVPEPASKFKAAQFVSVSSDACGELQLRSGRYTQNHSATDLLVHTDAT